MPFHGHKKPGYEKIHLRTFNGCGGHMDSGVGLTEFGGAHSPRSLRAEGCAADGFINFPECEWFWRTLVRSVASNVPPSNLQAINLHPAPGWPFTILPLGLTFCSGNNKPLAIGGEARLRNAHFGVQGLHQVSIGSIKDG